MIISNVTSIRNYKIYYLKKKNDDLFSSLNSSESSYEFCEFMLIHDSCCVHHFDFKCIKKFPCENMNVKVISQQKKPIKGLLAFYLHELVENNEFECACIGHQWGKPLLFQVLKKGK
jgi:hypothetical protein